jgi:hypothetical protein
MIKILTSKLGLKKGQKFDSLKTDGKLAVLKSKKRVAFIPIELLSQIEIEYTNGIHTEM